VPLLGIAFAPGCYVQTQRFPGPLVATEDPLPAGTLDLLEPGPEEALLVRHADQVLVRAAGTSAPWPLRFHDKRVRIAAGSWVQTGWGGRAELILADGSRIELSDTGSGVLGSESRREPLFALRDVTRASFYFAEAAQVALPGGAILASDSGPFVLERTGEHTMRLRNRSLRAGRVAFRDTVLDLAPGETAELAVPPSGSTPFQLDPAFRRLETDYGAIEVRGELEVLAAETGARLRALGEHEILAHGLVLRLDPGDEVWIQGIGRRELRAANQLEGNE